MNDETDDLAPILDDLHAALIRYVAFPDNHAARAVALWIAATHALPAFECAPRLVITSPQKRCAKSRLLDIIGGTCHEPLPTVNATVAAVFRSINATHPKTLLIDEADAIFGSKRAAEQNEDLRALLNAGHQRGRKALRCVGALQIPTEFETFAMAALAGKGIAWAPDTITDRAVNITMRRRTPSETVQQFRSRRDGPRLEALRDRLASWATKDHLDKLTKAEPKMPVEDRAADTWEPLIALADYAEGHWPVMARAACVALVDAAESADEERSHGVRLLSDIRQAFAENCVAFMPSQQMVNALRHIEESPWSEFELTPSKLAYRLREFGIRTRHNPSGSARGYRLEDFSDAFSRYTRQDVSDPSELQVKPDISSDASKSSDASTRQKKTTRQKENASLPGNLTPLTGSDGDRAGFVPPTGPDHAQSAADP